MTHKIFPLIFFFLIAHTAHAAGVQGGVSALVSQTNGQILVGGDFTAADGQPRTSLARFEPDGTLDAAFNPQLSAAFAPTVTAIAVQTDGRILISGEFSQVNGAARTRLARLNADGTTDAAFAAAVDVAAEEILIQPDGQILIVGGFTIVNGAARNRVARLNADGSLDSSFVTGAGANQTVEAVAVQTDGRILIGGQFTQFNGANVNRLARLTQTGALDSTFNAAGAGASGSVLEIVALSDGKFLVGGNFAQYNGANVNFLARVNADGSRDATFNSGGAGANNTIQTVVVQPNNKIVIGGFFGAFNGTIRNRLARLNADGSLDSLFGAGAGANGTLFDALVQTDGGIVIGGDFNRFDGVVRDSLFIVPNAPTAANVTVTGRVTAGARGVSKAVVALTDAGGATREILTNPFGYYRFAAVPAGAVYTVSARHKRYQFNPDTRIVSVNEDLTTVDFNAP